MYISINYVLGSGIDTELEVTFYMQDRVGVANVYGMMVAVLHGQKRNNIPVNLNSHLPTDYGVRNLDNFHSSGLFMHSCVDLMYVPNTCLSVTIVEKLH